MMLPIAAQFVRSATQERARSALPDSPVIQVNERPRAPALRPRRRVVAAIQDRRASGSRAGNRPSPIEQAR